jgi:hypothetical protein
LESAGIKVWRRTIPDLERVQGLYRELLGATAIAEYKTKYERCLKVIVYTINLDKKLVLISQKNVRKALYAFMSVRKNEWVTVKTIQKLASLGSRYGKVCFFGVRLCDFCNGLTSGRVITLYYCWMTWQI